MCLIHAQLVNGTYFVVNQDFDVLTVKQNELIVEIRNKWQFDMVC